MSGSGPGSSKYPYRMGEYTMVAGLVQTGRPVWLHATRRIYLFYGSELGKLCRRKINKNPKLFPGAGFWWFGDIYTHNESGYLRSGRAGEARVPGTGWEFRDFYVWTQDEELSVTAVQ